MLKGCKRKKSPFLSLLDEILEDLFMLQTLVVAVLSTKVVGSGETGGIIILKVGCLNGWKDYTLLHLLNHLAQGSKKWISCQTSAPTGIFALYQPCPSPSGKPQWCNWLEVRWVLPSHFAVSYCELLLKWAECQPWIRFCLKPVGLKVDIQCGKETCPQVSGWFHVVL